MDEPPGILAIRRGIADGTLSAQATLRASFERAHASQPRLQAFAYLPPALNIVETDPNAPLSGVAVAVKDLIDTADMPTTYGSPIYRGHQPGADAWIVQRLRRHGAHVLGKSVTTEFAWRHPGPTVNPWHAQHTPGGSSSGSAAAVAAGIVPLAIGTQTLGSVIRPAAYCGVVGFKPTYGAIPRTGVRALSGSLDHIGVFTRRVDDAAYAISLLAGTCASDVHGRAFAPFALADLRPDTDTGTGAGAAPVIGMLAAPQLGAVDADQAELMLAVAATLRRRGATVRELLLPPEFESAAQVSAQLAAAEAARHHASHLRDFRQLLSTPMAALLDEGSAMSAAQTLALTEYRHLLQQRYARWWLSNGIHALLVPPAAGAAPEGLDQTGDARFCSPFTLVGVPTITLPVARSAKGLPLGVQLVGAYGGDLSLLRIAQWCEQAIDSDRVGARAAGGWY